MNAIEIKGLCKKYTDFELDNISFQVPSGTIMGFVGENGAGKTTTIKAMLNLIKKDSGNIQILGMDSEQHEKEWKEQTGVVFDENCFPEVMNAKEIEKLMEQIYKKWDSSLYEKYLKEFEIDTKKIIQNYSKGMKMKLSIAVALAHHTQLLIEPNHACCVIAFSIFFAVPYCFGAAFLLHYSYLKKGKTSQMRA